MRTTIDRAGRLVVPKEIRDRVGLTAGAGVDVTERDGEVVLTPVGPRVVVVERAGRRVFAVEGDESPPLTDEDVRHLIDESRRWPRD